MNPEADWSAMTIYIPLRRRDGSVRARTLIDEADRHLAQHVWCMQSAGYAHRGVKQTESDWGRVSRVYLHREVVGLPRTGRDPQVDHNNRDRLDNRRRNLEIVTQKENLDRRICTPHGPSLANANQEVCARCGGPFSVVRWAGRTQRICKTCAAARRKQNYEKAKAKR